MNVLDFWRTASVGRRTRRDIEKTQARHLSRLCASSRESRLLAVKVRMRARSSRSSRSSFRLLGSSETNSTRNSLTNASSCPPRHASEREVAHRHCRAIERCECPAEADRSPLDLSAGLGIRLDIESRRDDVNAFMDAHRPAMCPEK
jgi:hypothetical protein